MGDDIEAPIRRGHYKRGPLLFGTSMSSHVVKSVAGQLVTASLAMWMLEMTCIGNSKKKKT